VESPQDKVPGDWSADGRFLLYQSTDPQTLRDLWVLPMSGANASPAGRSQEELEGDRKPWVFLKTNFEERQAQFSPDGRWVAYMSNESGQQEIYVRPFSGQSSPASPDAVGDRAGGQWQVSTAGGISTLWGPNGKELYYIAPDGKLMAVPIAVNGATLAPGTPVALFQARIYGDGTDNGQGGQYDVSRDGRFLINTVPGDAASPITLLQNWKPPAQ
jgi:hypothetical protein